MSKMQYEDELKLEQHAAETTASTASPSARRARGGSPRLTPTRLFSSHLGFILKDKQKEKEKEDARSRARDTQTAAEFQAEEEDGTSSDSDPAHTDVHLPEERQEPCGAEAESENNSFGSLTEEIRIQVTTEVRLIPLPGEEEPPTQLPDNASKDEDGDSNLIEDQDEEPSLQVVPQGSRKKNAMKNLEATLRKGSKSSKKHKKKKKESIQRIESPTIEATLSSRSRKPKRSVERDNESPDRNPSPTKRQSRHKNYDYANDDVRDKIQIKIQSVESHQPLNRSVSLAHETDSSSTPQSSREDSSDKLNQSCSSDSPRRRGGRGKSASQRKHNGPLHLCSSSDSSTPVKTEHCTAKHPMNTLHQLRNLNPLPRMSSSESYVEVAVSSASDDELSENAILSVPHHPSETESPSAMSSQSGSGCSKPSAAPDFIPFCSPQPASVPMRHYPPGSTGSPYAPNWSHPPQQYYPDTPAPAMHQGVFQWSQDRFVSDAIASLVQYPPPQHPYRPLFPNIPPPPGTAEYPIKRHSLPSTEEHLIPPVNRYSLPPHLPVTSESSTEPPPAPAPMPVVDKRFTCLQTLHQPPKPSIFGYQLIGDSMLVRFAQQILRENPILTESLRFIGYCVSGQRIGDLLKRLKSGFYHVGNKVVLMIGTNDLVKNSQAEQMIHELRRVLEHLCTKAEKIVVLTLPPVPLQEHYTHHWTRLNKYNSFIKTLENAEMGISVFDISPQYLLSKEELEEAELLADFNSDSPFCRGCLTCMEEVEEFSDSSWSDEDDMLETDLLTSVLISTSPTCVSQLSHIDICQLYCDKRIPKCRMDYFELKFESSNRKDLIHLNRKGLLLVRDALYKLQ